MPSRRRRAAGAVAPWRRHHRHRRGGRGARRARTRRPWHPPDHRADHPVPVEQVAPSRPRAGVAPGRRASCAGSPRSGWSDPRARRGLLGRRRALGLDRAGSWSAPRRCCSSSCCAPARASAAPGCAIVAEVDPARVTVGEPATGRISVTNESAPRRCCRCSSSCPSGVTAARFALPAAGRRATRTRSSSSSRPRAAASSRSARRRPCRATRSAWCAAPLTWTERTELFVHPRTVALESLGRRPAARPRGRDDRGRVDVRPRLPRAARVPARRRPPLHPLALARPRPASCWCASSSTPGART